MSEFHFLFDFGSHLARLAGEVSGEEKEELVPATLEAFNLAAAIVAFFFALRVLPSISRDVRKRSWLLLSLAAITFAIAEIIGTLQELGSFEVEGLYEATEAIFAILFAAGFYYLYNAEHRETLKLRLQSTTDDLTRLYTHGFFRTYLVNRVAGLKTDGTELTVLFLDIDDFKDYNDRFGHQEGDYVLQKVAETMRLVARGEDVASRYGGEEFTLIVGCDFDTACRVAERLRADIEQRCSTFADRLIRRSITVSIGLATFGRDSNSADKLVQIADARMYRAKAMGKNLVYIGDVDLEEKTPHEAIIRTAHQATGMIAADEAVD